MNQHLGVAVIGTESVSPLDQFGPHAGMIVDFTVEGGDHGAIFIAHGLRRCNVEVDDRETAMTETDLAIRRHPAVGTVRPTMGHGVPHVLEDGALDRACAIRQ